MSALVAWRAARTRRRDRRAGHQRMVAMFVPFVVDATTDVIWQSRRRSHANACFLLVSLW
jgi:hypothetical protein